MVGTAAFMAPELANLEEVAVLTGDFEVLDAVKRGLSMEGVIMQNCPELEERSVTPPTEQVATAPLNLRSSRIGPYGATSKPTARYIAVCVCQHRCRCRWCCVDLCCESM